MILIAPTAFKETIGAAAAARALAAGARSAAPEADIVVLPLSDGGPGLIDALAALGGIERVRVTGPLGDPVEARVLITAEEAIIESADACGLHHVPLALRDPLRATTLGVGETILAAAQRVARELRHVGAGPRDDAMGQRGAPRPNSHPAAGRGHGGAGHVGDRASDLRRDAGQGDGTGRRRALVIGLGGSATVDGGAGMAAALGWRLLDRDGRPIAPGGAGLVRVAHIEPPAPPRDLPPVVALADVRSPLLGAEGAAPVFAPQKGADAAAVRLLEEGLARLAEVIARDLRVDVATIEGGGAAGGLGAAAVAFVGARLQPGAEWLLERVGFDAALRRASVVVTGEGAYDAQTALGKIVGLAIARARSAGVPVLLVAGRVESPPPPGVVWVDGRGGALDEAGLTAAVAAALPGLLSGRAAG